MASAMASLSALLLLLAALLLCSAQHAVTASVSFRFLFSSSAKKETRKKKAMVVLESINVRSRGFHALSLSLSFSLFTTPPSNSKQVFTPEDEAAVVSSLQALDLSAM